MPKVPSALVIALFVAATSEPANAVDVKYTLSFAGTGGNRANGTGTLIVNEPTPINSFSENSYEDVVSLTANIGGRTYIFAPSSVDVDLGTIKHSPTASRVHLHLVWSDRMVSLEAWCLAEFGFWIVNAGGPHLDVGRFTIGQGVVQGPPATEGLRMPSGK